MFKKYWPLCAEMRTASVILIPAQYPTIILNIILFNKIIHSSFAQEYRLMKLLTFPISTESSIFYYSMI